MVGYNLKGNKMKQYNEVGRSMVEMLGVLAIVGVLSVGAIAGYTVAMKKHRANEMLDRVSHWAIKASAQAMAGEIPSVSGAVDGFAGCGGCYFSAERNRTYGNENQFVVNMMGPISKELCRQAFTYLGGSTPINEIYFLDGSHDVAHCDNLSGGMTSLFFVFDDDLRYTGNSAGGVPPDENENKPCNGRGIIQNGVCHCYDGFTGTECEGGAGKMACGAEATGYWYVNSDGAEGCLCHKGYYGELCDSVGEQCNGHGYWFSGTSNDTQFSVCICDDGYEGNRCEESQNDGTCTTNADCGDEEYCKRKLPFDDSCNIVNKGGVCTSVTGGTTRTCKSLKLTYSSSSMYWVEADNWCKAQGKKMPSLSDLGCTVDGCSTPVCPLDYVLPDNGYWVSDTEGTSTNCGRRNLDLRYGNYVNHGGASALCIDP